MEPAPVDAAQAALTERHLADTEALDAFFRALRRSADPALARRYPRFGTKTYPLGRCREIRDAVFDGLQARIRAPRCDAARSIAAFVGDGGAGRKIWGALRGSYFQNAIQLGAWYVDVANDTVVADKPPVEILPLADVDMVPIADYRHFAAIAEPYWSVRVYRNSVLPNLAPILPLLCVDAGGRAWTAVGYDQVIELTRRAAFAPSLAALEEFPDPPGPVADRLRRLVAGEETPLFATGGDPVDAVKRAIGRGLHEDVGFRDRCATAHVRLEALASGRTRRDGGNSAAPVAPS